MYKCVVIDDSEMSLLSVRELIRPYLDFQIERSFEDAEEALKYLKRNSVDLVFIDILMPQLTGFDVLSKVGRDVNAIIISDHKEFAIDAFSFDVIDYLHKPIGQQRFAKAIDRFVAKVSVSADETTEGKEFIFVKVDGIFRKISMNEIVLIESVGNYVNIHTTKDVVSFYATIKEMETKLTNKKFFRPHRSFLVSSDFVEGLDENVIITSVKMVPISRERRRDVYFFLGLR